MQYNKLLDSLSDQAKAEREEIIAAARKKAEAIVKAAVDGVEEKPQVAEEVQAAVEEVKAAAGPKEARKKESAPQRRRLSRAVLQAQYEYYLQAIETAKNSLRKICERPDYSQMLKKLLQEAAVDFPAAATVLVRPQDVAVVKGVLDELNLKLVVVSSQEAPVGVVVSSQNGKLVRYNTLNSRLEKALPHLSTRIANVLYG